MPSKSQLEKVPEGFFDIQKEYNTFYMCKVTREGGTKYHPTNYEAEYRPQICRVGRRASKTFRPIYK